MTNSAKGSYKLTFSQSLSLLETFVILLLQGKQSEIYSHLWSYPFASAMMRWLFLHEIDCSIKPIIEIRSVCSALLDNVRVNLPSKPVTIPLLVPFWRTVAPIISIPWASLTIPLTLVCAQTCQMELVKHMNNIIIFFMFSIY